MEVYYFINISDYFSYPLLISVQMKRKYIEPQQILQKPSKSTRISRPPPRNKVRLTSNSKTLELRVWGYLVRSVWFNPMHLFRTRAQPYVSNIAK